MKKIIILIGITILLGVTGWWLINPLQQPLQMCGQGFSWGRNVETGQCRYFSSTCLNRGYERVSARDCDCQNLEDYLQPYAFENCSLNQLFCRMKKATGARAKAR